MILQIHLNHFITINGNNSKVQLIESNNEIVLRINESNNNILYNFFTKYLSEQCTSYQIHSNCNNNILNNNFPEHHLYLDNNYYKFIKVIKNNSFIYYKLKTY